MGALSREENRDRWGCCLFPSLLCRRRLVRKPGGKRKDDWKQQQPVEKLERNLDFRREFWQLLLPGRCGVYEGIRRRRRKEMGKESKSFR